jgi:hypothetical protein
MIRTCENCSRPLFDTDTICWHCGQKQSLPSQLESTAEQEQPSSDSTIEDDPEPEPEPVAPVLTLFYGGLTVVVALALLLTIRSLGQSPIVTLKPDSSQGEWVSLTSLDKSFTIDIPAKWGWQFLEEKRAKSSITDLLENDNRIMTAITPLGDLVPDVEYLLVAQNDSSLLVVARSERLNRLSAQQAVTSLQEEQFDNIIVTEADLIQAASGEAKAVFTLKHKDTPLQCDQYFVPGSSETYVVATCSLIESYKQQQGDFETILDSFSIKSR